ncbi:MAG: hypothetical protein ACK4UO_06105 [Pseudolabrys sp.]
MSEPGLITFERRGGHLLAKLGVWEVGCVGAIGGATYWRVFLPGLSGAARRVSSGGDEDQARGALERTIREWVDAGQLAFASERVSSVRAFRIVGGAHLPVEGSR